MTTVEVSTENWKRLHSHREPTETMDDVVGDALDALETAHNSPTEKPEQ